MTCNYDQSHVRLYSSLHDYGIGHQIANPVLKYSECCNKRISPSEAQLFANEQSEMSQPRAH